ncbi:tudor domain-containing protein 15 [Melanotaenia boesemani]|uniref:tudor domain-containing protein 15 n=1 Tax=Melanotaenia boesemani TaxID=1250792 RepID=UPI001C04FF1C|nr:tudor domain-containing protein 15 [Melanotaenia boesemani]
MMTSDQQKSEDLGPSAPCARWPVDLKLTHLDWNPETTLIHFQGQYVNICELDYNILQKEIQTVPKSEAEVDIGEFVLVEDLTSAHWFRGRVQNRKENQFDVFLVDHGNVLSVDIAHISLCSSDLLILPPKIVCGFLSNVLLLQTCCHSVVGEFLLSLVGRSVKGFIKAVLPHSVILLEAPDINSDLVKHGFGRHVDTNTFLFLAEMLTEVPLKQNIEPGLDLPIEIPSGQKLKSSNLNGYREFLSFCGPQLRCGTRAKVRITGAFSPGLFYCQMTSVKNDLWHMSKKLAEICEYRTEKHDQKTSENLGQLCAVKGKDGKWNRGFLQFLPVNSEVRVLLIDYGFYESVHVENIHKLPPDCYSAPMAFPCVLPSLIDQDTALKTKQLSLLKAGFLGGVLDVEVISFDKEWHLHTITLICAEDKHVEEPQPIQKLPTKPVFDVVKATPQGGYAYHETVMAEALANAVKAEQVQVGSVFMGYVEYAQNPNHFWIRTQKRNDEFEEMMEKMADHFSHVKLDEDILLNQEVGAKCCALYEKDMHFYRGVVTDTLKHGAEVLYIDFGNIEKVPHMLVKNIPETFASTSQFAICCTLAKVFPLDDIWPSDTSDLFRKAVSNKALQVHVVQVRKTKLVVDLVEVGSDNSIAELMSSSNLAEYIPVDHKVQNKDLTEKTRCLQHSVDVCRKPEQWDKCQQDENLSKNEISKVKATASFKTLSIKPGSEFPVRCSYISSPSDFWCQPLDQAPKLEKLMVELQQYYSAHTVPLQPGDLCCVAKSPQDGRWYRGFIIGKVKSHATVMLVDFGSTIQVREHSLQAVLPEHLCLEEQAFRCSLFNLTKPADPEDCGDWNPEACDLVTDFVLNSADSLMCKVMSQLNVKNYGLCNVIYLYNTKTQQSAMDTFIKQGLAVTKQSEVSPESFVPFSFDLSSGNEEQVFVTHISSQCEVYCQLERNTEIIEELEGKISEELEKILQPNTGAVMKKLCLAKYLDGKWYRALALPTQSPLHLSVFFVDYGNTFISEINQVRFIPRDCVDLLCTPMQAVRCNLTLVPTEELYAAAKEWLNNTILNKVMRAVVRGKREDGSFDVELYDGEININEKLQELIISFSPKPKALVSCVKSNLRTKQTTQQTNKQKIFKCKNVPKGQSSTSATSPHGGNKNKKTKKLFFNKNKRKEPQNENNTKCSSPVKPQIQVQPQRECRHEKSKKSWPTEEREMPKASCLLNKNLTAGFRTKCFTSHIDSVNSFFLQLSEDEPAILKMGEDLNSAIFCNSLKKVTSSRIDDAVLAEFEDDGALYRSVVKTLESSSCFKVEFVDYGNLAVVGKEKIYHLPKEYHSQPRFSIPCSLLDTSLYQNSASFIDAVTERPLMVDFVRQCGIQWKVKLEILDQEVGLDTTLEKSLLTENKEETSQSLPESEEKIRSLALNEKSTKTSTVEVPRPATMSAKLKVKTIRLLRRQCTGNKSHRKRKKSFKTTHFLDSFLPPTIQSRDTENATILSVQSDGSFYIRLTRTSDLLMDLETFISDNICKYKAVSLKDVRQGLKCLVQVQDKMWQRAIVLHKNKENSKVFLVDHGITKDIPSGSIRQQCKDMKKFPNFAMLCKINSLGFDGGEDAHKYWCENLKPIIGTEVRLIFIFHSETDNLWMVEIILDELFLTRQIKASLQQKKILSPAETKPTSDTCAPQRLTFAPLDPDREYSGFAAAVTTPFKFCVIVEDLLPIKNKVSIMLDSLLRETSPLLESHLVPGTCCLLKSDSMNKWCRAEIICVNTTVRLKLVDHGQHECVPYCDFSNLKTLPLELVNLPKVTCPCILRGVKPVGVDRQWTDEAAVFFQQLLYQKKLRIFFRDFVSNSHWKVDILADGVHVAKELVDAGHADYMDILLGLRFQVESSCKPLQGPDSEEEESSEGSLM